MPAPQRSGRAVRGGDERRRGRFQYRDDLVGRERWILRQHQRDRSRDHRRREARAAFEAERIIDGSGAPAVRQHDDSIVLLDHVEATAGCRQGDARTEVAVGGEVARGGRRCDGDDPRTARGCVVRNIGRAVPGRDDDRARHAVRVGRADDRRVDRVAAPAAAEAQVDHLRGRWIRGHARHRQTRGPGDAVGDVRIVAAAAPQHAHRQDLRVPVDARGPVPIIAVRGDDAGHTRTVPRTCPYRTICELSGLHGTGQPVPRVGRIRVAAIAVVRHGGVGDHVVTR